MSNKAQIMEQFRKAFLMFASGLTDEQAMEVATIYDPWKVGKKYVSGDRFTYGVNNVGDPQLYKVNDGKDHISQADWTPNIERSLYTPIGLDFDGYTVWAQPTGVHDAYNTGDIVSYNGVLYESLIDGNTYSPDVYPAGWKVVSALYDSDEKTLSGLLEED